VDDAASWLITAVMVAVLVLGTVILIIWGNWAVWVGCVVAGIGLFVVLVSYNRRSRSPGA
jgi:ABC-type multidrug transport system fused ATPase/permease subunit